MPWLRGFARKPEGPTAPPNQPWAIVDRDDQLLVFFDHKKFPRILDGAPVAYTVGDDGFADNVQSLDSVERYVGRFVARNDIAEALPVEVDERLRLLIMEALLEANDLDGDARDRRLRRLRLAVDRLTV